MSACARPSAAMRPDAAGWPSTAMRLYMVAVLTRAHKWNHIRISYIYIHVKRLTFKYTNQQVHQYKYKYEKIQVCTCIYIYVFLYIQVYVCTSTRTTRLFERDPSCTLCHCQAARFFSYLPSRKLHSKLVTCSVNFPSGVFRPGRHSLGRYATKHPCYL